MLFYYLGVSLYLGLSFFFLAYCLIKTHTLPRAFAGFKCHLSLACWDHRRIEKNKNTSGHTFI